MQTIIDKQSLLDAIHNKKILVKHCGMYLHVTEKSFVDGLKMDENHFNVTLFTIQSGDNQIVVIDKVARIAHFAVNKKPSYEIKPWWRHAVAMFNF